MANDEVRIKIKIDSNSQELVLMKQQVQDLGNSFNKTDSMASSFNSKIDALNSKVHTMGNSFNKTDSMVASFTNRLLSLGGAYLTLNAAFDAGKSVIHQADSMKSLDARLKLATSSTSEYLSEQKKLTQISLNTHTAISDTITLFTKINPALKQVGANTNQVNSVVKSFTEGLQLGGASATESSSAILQFSQAMGSGVLRGEEFNAMAEASPKLMEYMAKGLGVPQTALRKMAEDGELTAVRVSNALLSMQSDIERDFKTMPVIVDKAMTDFSTYMSLGIKDIDDATGASTLLSNEILNFGKNISDISEGVISFYQNSSQFIKDHNEALDTTGTILKTVASAYVGFAVTSGIATGIGAITTSVYALRASILALETSIPVIGWVAAAVGVAAGAYVYSNDKINRSTLESMDLMNDMSDKTTLLSKQQELLKQKSVIQNDKFMWDSKQSTLVGQLDLKLAKVEEKLDNIRKASGFYNIIPDSNELTNGMNQLVSGFDGYVKVIDKIDTKKKTFSELTQEIQKQIDPVRAIREEYNKLRKDIKGTEADTPEYNKSLNQKELDDIANLDKEKISKAKELANEQKRIAKDKAAVESEFNLIGLNEWDTKFKELDNKYNADLVKYQDVVGSKTKLDAIYADNLKNLTNQKNIEIQKEDLSFFERKIQLQDDSLSKELELQGVSYTSRILEIENSTKSIAEKDKLIAKQTELFNLTVQNMNYKYDTEFQDTMSNFYDDMLDSQLALNNAVYDFGSGFDGAASKIGNVSKSIAAMSSLELTNKKEASKLDKKYIEQFNKYAGDVEKTKELEQQYTKDTAILNEQNIQAQLAGYANIAGSMSTMFNEGSREAASFQLIEAGLALSSGIRAILTQGSGDPYTAFARMAAMAATVSSMLGNIGIAFGMNTTTISSDVFSAMTANDGSGTALGSTEQTKSITNSLDILKDFAEPQFDTLLQMSKSLASIDEKIGGVSSLLIQNGGFAFGDGYSGFDTGYSNNLNIGSLGTTAMVGILSGGAGILLDKFTGGALSGIVNSVLGGVFGKTSVSQKLKDSGIYFADTLLTSAIEQFDGEAYQTIATTTTKKSWFSKSSKTSIKSYFDELDTETERQFSLVFDNLYSTVLTAGTALDSKSADTAKSLENFVVNLGKISLKDKTGTEIQELLTSAFGKVGDDIAKTAFPLLTDFQQVGEGMFETLTRVATGMETADYYTSRLGNRFDDVIYTAIGNKQGDVGFEALLQSIQAVEVATYPTNNNLYKIVSNLDATAEELYSMYTNLDELRDRLIFLKQDAQALSSSMIYGAGSVSALDDGFQAYFENFLSENEQLTYKTQQLIQNFNDLGVSLPISKDGFKDLLNGIDKTSESGQELYGRLIILSESFADVATSTKESIDTLTSSLDELSTNSFDSFISSLDSVGQSIKSIKQTALGFINGFTTSNDASLEDQIISYNKLRGQFADYFDNNGIIKSGVNTDTVSGLYSQITSLASNISGKDSYLKDSLISQVSSDLIKFNSAEDVLKVNIVEGLGSLLNLSIDSKGTLKTALADGVLTDAEIAGMSLSDTQKQALIDAANNTGLFTIDTPLGSLNEYAKKQLEVLQQTQANETANLSSQTLTYGDYIGKQEQIDIATKLGVSYDTAKPLIEKIQQISTLPNATSEIQSLVGFTPGATTYDTTVASQLKTLQQYTGMNITGVLNDIDSQIALTKESLALEDAKQKAIATYNASDEKFVKDTYMKILGREADTSGLKTFTSLLANGTFSKDNLGQNLLTSSYQNNEINNKDYISKLYKFGLGREADLDGLNFHLGRIHKGENYIERFKASILGNDRWNSFDVGSTYIDRDQFARIHKGEIITPPTFSDGIRNGDLVMGDNNKVVEAIKNLEKVTISQAREIQKMAESLNEFNTRDLIKTAKGVA